MLGQIKDIIVEASPLAEKPETRDVLGYEERQAVEANRNHIALAGTNVNI